MKKEMYLSPAMRTVKMIETGSQMAVQSADKKADEILGKSLTIDPWEEDNHEDKSLFNYITGNCCLDVLLLL